MNKNIKQKAFTLVELIVVITILAVLATVAFVSFQWYGQSSRDSVRLADLRSMEKVNDLYRLTHSKYPTPNDSIWITYSWSTAWIQWVFWTNSYSSNTSLSNVPTDPLTGLPYSYSITNTKQEYQIAVVLEWEVSQLNTQSYAWDQIASVYVKWDYNGKFIKVHTWSLDYLLWVPSIIASDITSVDMMEIINNQRLVYKWYNNLPASYSWSIYNNNGWFNFTPNQVILFEWEVSDLVNSPTERITFLDNLQTNYSWSVIASESNIAEIINTDSGSNHWNNIVANLLNNSLNTNITILDVPINQINTGSSDIYYNLFTVLETRKSEGNPIWIYQDHLQNITLFNNKLYFIAEDKIWVSDWTDSWTNILRDITVWHGHSNLIEYNNALYFGANDGVYGYELWKTDGSSVWTTMVMNLNPGAWSSFSPYLDPEMQVINNKLYFSADNWIDWYELIEFNATNNSATIKMVWSTANSWWPSQLTTVGNNLFFIASDDSYEKEVYVLNTTNGVVSLVKDLPGWSYHAADKIYNYNDKVLFTHRAWFSNYETRISDGTDSWTVKVYEWKKVYNFGFLWNNIFFRWTNAWYDKELFISDGTLAGTNLFMDIDTWSSSSPNFNSSKVFNNKLLFTASDSVNWQELWETDGTISGTNIIWDIYSWSNWSSPSIAQIINNTVYLYANDWIIGKELWSLSNTGDFTSIEDFTAWSWNTNFSYSFVKNNKFYFTDYNGSYNSSTYLMEYDNLYYLDTDNTIQRFDIFLYGMTG